jgi:iron complex outermembrane receptor protein
VTITVLGKKAVHATKVPIGASLIDDLPAGANPMAAIAISGRQFPVDRPQGISTWSNQIFIHGFDQRAVGMTLDEMPLGEMTYRNYNGLSPMQALTSENVAGVDMFQSAGADPSLQRTTWAVHSPTSVDPSHQMGASVTQGFGSYSNFHTFVRLESGDLNDTGTLLRVLHAQHAGQVEGLRRLVLSAGERQAGPADRFGQLADRLLQLERPSRARLSGHVA